MNQFLALPLFPKQILMTCFVFVIISFNLHLFPLPVPNTTPVRAAEFATFITSHCVYTIAPKEASSNLLSSVIEEVGSTFI